jgi:hypothetical protein
VTEPVHQITALPNEPYFEAPLGDKPDEPWNFPVSIDARPFLVDTTLTYYQAFARRAVQLLNTQNTGDKTGDSVALPPEVWRRNMDSWHLGMGQERFDRTDSLDHRYHDSRHISPWDQWGISLLPETTKAMNLPAGPSRMVVVNNVDVFVGCGTDGHWFVGGVRGVAPTNFPLPADLLDACSDGARLYVLLSNGEIHTILPGALTTTHYATLPVIPQAGRGMLAFTKGFLIAGSNNLLYTFPLGVPTLLFTAPSPSHTWRAACEGLSVGYVLGGSGDRWSVYRMGINSTATNLDPPIVAATVPDGEIGYSVASYLGYVLIGLNTGWRFGMPNGNGDLTFGQLVDTTAPVQCFEGQDRFVWYGQSLSASAVAQRVTREKQVDPQPKDSRRPSQRAFGVYSCGLGRADLSNFVAPMTPAYCNDLDVTSPTAVFGVVSNVITVGAGPEQSGYRVFTVDGNGVYTQAETLCEEGWLTQGAMSFGTADEKRGMYALGFHDALVGSVYVDVRLDDGGWRQIGADTFEESVSMGKMPMHEAFHLAELRYRLERDAPADKIGPRFTRAEFRCIPIPGTTTEWHIPLILSQDIIFENNREIRDTYEDYQYLVGLVQQRKRFVYREGGHRWTLVAVDMEFHHRNLTPRGDSYQGIFHLIARELD